MRGLRGELPQAVDKRKKLIVFHDPVLAMDQPANLSLRGLDDPGMAMAGRSDTNAGREVEIGLPLIVEQMAATACFDDERRSLEEHR